ARWLVCFHDPLYTPRKPACQPSPEKIPWPDPATGPPVAPRRPRPACNRPGRPIQTSALLCVETCAPWSGIARVKFNLLDKIESISDQRVVAVKHVTLAEEYLADHFPTFPVLPGVLMLEALTQAATWLLHRRHEFARSMAVLKEARNVRYGRFVAPGGSLRLEVELNKPTESGASFKAAGSVDGAPAVQARI